VPVFLARLGVQFNLDKAELGTIAATAFWDFHWQLFIGGMVVDVNGMKRLLVLAFIFHLVVFCLPFLLAVLEIPFWALFISNIMYWYCHWNS
jgi:hypothetical protein